MKFLAVPSLEKLSAVLSSVDLGDRLISCKVEAYSCKQAGEDKKFSKALERQISDQYFPNQPPSLHSQRSSTSSNSASSTMNVTESISSSAQSHFSPVSSPLAPSPITPLGPIGESSTRKLLISLIQTMNAALSDYDFSQMRAEQFGREPATQKVKESVNNLFLSALDHVSGNGIREEFWKAVNDCIDCDKCEIYSFAPDPDSDLGVNRLWYVMYFFFNKKAKKILFISCEGGNKLSMKNTAPTPAPSKYSGFKRAMDRSKNTGEHENGMDEGNGKAEEAQRRNSLQSVNSDERRSNAMLESSNDDDSRSSSKAGGMIDSAASSTDDDTENQDEQQDDEDEERTLSKRRRRHHPAQRRRSSKSASAAEEDDEEAMDGADSDDGGDSVASSMTDGYSFDPDSDEQLAQIRQAAELQASEAKVSGSPLNMPLPVRQQSEVFSKFSLAVSSTDGTPKQTTMFPFTPSSLSPYIAAVSFHAAEANKPIPALTLQPAAGGALSGTVDNITGQQQLDKPQLKAYQRSENSVGDELNQPSRRNTSKAAFNNSQGRSILTQRA